MPAMRPQKGYLPLSKLQQVYLRAMSNLADRSEHPSSSMLPVREPKTVGDCFEAAGCYLMDNHRRWRHLELVHGEVVGQGQIVGIRHGHAWCETDGWVIDTSNGRYIRVPSEVYYELGQIGDNLKRYTMKDLQQWVRKTGHWGPWELEVSTEL